MKKIFLILFLIIPLSIIISNFIIAHGDFNETKRLIDSKISCKELTNDQLEEIGEYYMEQMHPGESHELMHKMMALKEGSEAEEQFHINMAKIIYCGESGEMMGSGGMMGQVGMYGMIMPGMMNSYPAFSINGWLLTAIFILIIISLILLILRLYRDLGNNLNKKRR